MVRERHRRAPRAAAPLERVGGLHRRGTDRDPTRVGDAVVLEHLDRRAEHVDPAEHDRDARLDELLSAGGGALGGEVGVADLEADRTTVHAAELLVDEVDRRVRRLAQLRVRTARGVLLVHHAEHQLLAGGFDGLVGDQVADGGLAGALEQSVTLAPLLDRRGRAGGLGALAAGVLGLAARRAEQRDGREPSAEQQSSGRSGHREFHVHPPRSWSRRRRRTSLPSMSSHPPPGRMHRAILVARPPESGL